MAHGFRGGPGHHHSPSSFSGPSGPGSSNVGVPRSTRSSSYWDSELKCIMDNDIAGKVMSEVAQKREVRKARHLFEASGQAQPPSKDFLALLITEKGIIWSKWRITLRGYTSGAAPVPMPQEEVMSFTDFKCNDSLQDEVRRSFGENTLEHIDRIITGSNDVLSCTPESIMLRICSMLDLQSISQLSRVNRHLRNLCLSDNLWSDLYHQHQGHPSLEICSLANEIGWMKVFYSSKLQLQKEISRRRKPAFPTTNLETEMNKMTFPSTSSKGNATSTSKDTTFLTENSNSNT